MEWRNLYRGFLIGTSDLIPGVSGGTVALMLGIYDELLEAIGGLFSRNWRNHVNFLLPLGVGMAGALIGLSRIIKWLLAEHPGPTQFLFFGLVVGILPPLVTETRREGGLKASHVVAFLSAGLLAASMAFFHPDGGQAVTTNLTPVTVAGLFGAGLLASTAMLLPGISGAFVLLVLGVYPTALHALSTFHWGLIFVIGSGVAVGFIGSSRLIRYVLQRWPNITRAAIIGLLAGSLVVLWPGLPEPTLPPWILSIGTFGLGFGLTRLLGHKES